MLPRLALAFTLLCVVAGVAWFYLRPPNDNAPEPLAVDEQPRLSVAKSPPADVGPPKIGTTTKQEDPSVPGVPMKPPEKEVKEEKAAPKNEEKDVPRQPEPEPKSAPGEPKVVLPKVEPPIEKKPLEKLNIGLAAAFASKILRANEIITRKYHRDRNKVVLGVSAIRGLYAAAQVEIPAPIEKRIQQIQADDQIAGLLVDARVEFGSRPEFADPRDVEAALRHVCRQLDAHSALMDAHAMERLRWQQNTTKLSEIGILTRRQPGGAVEVRLAYKDGPAFRAGVRAGDVITHFKPHERGEAEPRTIPAAALSEDELERLLWGPTNSVVSLVLERPAIAEPLELEISRGLVKKEKLLGAARNFDDSWEFIIDDKRGFYYVRVVDFQDRNVVTELDELLTREKDRIKGLVLDLRFADGGLIETATRLADLFVDERLIVEFRWRDEGVGRTNGTRKGTHQHFPMACLVDTTSGACTEIVAACLQDHRRAAIVGERTSGNSSVQNYFPFEQYTLRLTTSHAYRPSGKSLSKNSGGEPGDEWGVTPDLHYRLALSKNERDSLRQHLFELQLPTRDLPDTHGEFEDRQLEGARDYLRRKSEGEFVFP